MTEREIFLALLDLPDAEARAAYLGRACGGDDALRARVESLLRSHDSAGSFLGSPAVVLPEPVPAFIERFEYETIADNCARAAPEPLATTGDFSPVQRSGETPETLPEQFGRYRIIKRLGQGGMGSVFLAEDTQLRRLVALKVPEFGPQQGAEARRRFLEEARTAATLDHSFLCPVFDIGEFNGRLYLTMAYIEGNSLAELAPGKTFTPRQVAALVGKLALAMQEAHKKKVIHRDLKPANVMIKTTGERREPVIVDFGLAHRQVPGEERLTRTGQVFGTLSYMAPEQVQGDLNEIGPACDIYALGVMLYELLTGRTPFRGKGLAIVSEILNEAPPPLSTFRSDIDPVLEAICLKAMAKRLGDRYASMSELAAALTAYLRSLSAAPPAESPAGPPASAELPRATGSDTLVAQFFDGLVTEQASDSLIATPKPVASPSPLPGRRRNWRPLIVAAGVLGVLLLGVIISAARDKGRNRMVANDPKAGVKIDREPAPVPADSPVAPEQAIASRESAKAPGPAPTPTAAADSTDPPKEAIPGQAPERAMEPAPAPAVVANSPVPPKEITPLDPAPIPADSPVPPKGIARSSSKKSGAGRPTGRARPPPKQLTNSLGMKLVLIPAGSFFMGSSDTDSDARAGEKPQHPVRITRAFYLGMTEVTVGQFRRFVEKTGYRTVAETDGKASGVFDVAKKAWEYDPKSTWRTPGFPQTDEHPVVQVSWKDATAFCDALSLLEGLKPFDHLRARQPSDGEGYRLPTEAEWEYACRAGNATRYGFSDDAASLGPFAWYDLNSNGGTHPVRQKWPNAAGLYDMHGNVWEWCWDGYDVDFYKKSPGLDPFRAWQGGLHVSRGGSWLQLPQFCRSAIRDGYAPGVRNNGLGFRVARVQSGG